MFDKYSNCEILRFKVKPWFLYKEKRGLCEKEKKKRFA